ncbi:MAG: tannase/feruloyl esterase family alpha/beta hydrolase [Terriglobia bacterium]
MKLPQTTITEAKSVPAGPFALPGGFGPQSRGIALPAFCRVKGVIKPATDSDIGFEVWMPAKGWNGKFVGVGNGVFAGTIDFGALAAAIQAGFAAAATDTGHIASPLSAQWADGHPQKVIDYGYRAIHLNAVIGKEIVRKYYASAPRWSYFASCSTGGRQGLMEAQRFPDDYNGVLAGDPANYFTHLVASAVWDSQAVDDSPASFIPPSKLNLLGKAVLAACDAQDGVKDGIVSYPMRCHFNPRTLLCKGADSNGCLTAPQVVAVEKIYAGPSNSKGQNLFPGFSPGSEGGWALWIVGSAPDRSIDYPIGSQFFSNFVFDDPTWNPRSLNFESDMTLTDKKLASVLNATDPNLSRFEARGGKLILYHGWADAAIPPMNTVNYFKSVVGAMGEKQTGKFVRLYMVPGMQHCGGGVGPDSFGAAPSVNVDAEHSMFDSLELWVEHGTAPGAIIATKRSNPFNPGSVVQMTCPLCPYPEVARYKGSGDTNQAANFICATEPQGYDAH